MGAKRKLQIIAEMLEIMATGVQNAATLTACLTASQPADPAPAQRAHAHAPPVWNRRTAIGEGEDYGHWPPKPPCGCPTCPSRGTAESNDREWKWSQVDWCNDRNGICGGKK